METQDRQGDVGHEGGKPSPVLRWVGVVSFGVLFVVNALLGKWLPAAFFLATVPLFLLGRRIDNWPKAARVIAILVYAALAVAMFVQLIQELKARG